MKRLVEFPVENGDSIVVEVDEPGDKMGMVRVARPGEIAETARVSFVEAVNRALPSADAIITSLRQIAVPPNEIEIEFGLKLSAEAGAFIASAGTEGNFKVALTWRRGE